MLSKSLAKINDSGGRMKVYVGNLPYKVTDKDLKEMFAEYGEVTEAVVISDKY